MAGDSPLRRRSDWHRRFARDRFRRAAVAVLAVLGCVILAIAILQTRSNHAISAANSARSKAQSALQQAESALGSLPAIVARLQEEALGECNRVQILRADASDAFTALHQAFDLVATSRPPRRATPARKALLRHFAKLYRAYASHVRVIPPTDCRLATSDPLHYMPPAPRLPSLAEKRAAAIPLR